MKTEEGRLSTVPIGSLKRVRYMVNSTLEFLEILHTVNAMIGTIQDRLEVERIQRAASFSVIPLPHSKLQFVACLDLPVGLLGVSAVRRPLLLDYSEFAEPKPKTEFVRDSKTVTTEYPVKNLFDINRAIYHFEASLAPHIPQAQWMRVKRSLAVAMQVYDQDGQVVEMAISVEANPSLSLTSAIR